MAKPQLADSQGALCGAMIETFLAGHHSYRPDLKYPESHSDMEGGIRALMQMFEIKRRPIAVELELKQH